MLIQVDDDLYRVDRVFLGPKGKPWPVRATYRAYVFWIFFALGFLILWRIFGLPWHFMGFFPLALLSYPFAKWCDKKLSADRPLVAALERFGQELLAPRPAPQKEVEIHHQLEVRRWSFDAAPEQRFPARLLAKVKKMRRRSGGRVYRNGAWTDVV